MTLKNYKESKLQGAFSIDGFTVGDKRGRFTKCFVSGEFASLGVKFNLSEAFFSSSESNVVRGLHFQTRNPQAKLVTVVSGRAIDYIVDLRVDSPTFLQWESFELTPENAKAVYVPRGFGHGFISLSDSTTMLYLCDGEYDKETDTGILFTDPQIGIELPIDDSVAIRSERDLHLMTVAEYIKNPIQI